VRGTLPQPRRPGRRMTSKRAVLPACRQACLSRGMARASQGHRRPPGGGRPGLRASRCHRLDRRPGRPRGLGRREEGSGWGTTSGWRWRRARCPATHPREPARAVARSVAVARARAIPRRSPREMHTASRPTGSPGPPRRRPPAGGRRRLRPLGAREPSFRRRSPRSVRPAATTTLSPCLAFRGRPRR